MILVDILGGNIRIHVDFQSKFKPQKEFFVFKILYNIKCYKNLFLFRGTFSRCKCNFELVFYEEIFLYIEYFGSPFFLCKVLNSSLIGSTHYNTRGYFYRTLLAYCCFRSPAFAALKCSKRKSIYIGHSSKNIKISYLEHCRLCIFQNRTPQ